MTVVEPNVINFHGKLNQKVAKPAVERVLSKAETTADTFVSSKKNDTVKGPNAFSKFKNLSKAIVGSAMLALGGLSLTSCEPEPFDVVSNYNNTTNINVNITQEQSAELTAAIQALIAQGASIQEQISQLTIILNQLGISLDNLNAAMAQLIALNIQNGEKLDQLNETLIQQGFTLEEIKQIMIEVENRLAEIYAEQLAQGTQLGNIEEYLSNITVMLEAQGFTQEQINAVLVNIYTKLSEMQTEMGNQGQTQTQINEALNAVLSQLGAIYAEQLAQGGQLTNIESMLALQGLSNAQIKLVLLNISAKLSEMKEEMENQGQTQDQINASLNAIYSKLGDIYTALLANGTSLNEIKDELAALGLGTAETNQILSQILQAQLAANNKLDELNGNVSNLSAQQQQQYNSILSYLVNMNNNITAGNQQITDGQAAILAMNTQIYNKLVEYINNGQTSSPNFSQDLANIQALLSAINTNVSSLKDMAGQTNLSLANLEVFAQTAIDALNENNTIVNGMDGKIDIVIGLLTGMKNMMQQILETSNNIDANTTANYQDLINNQIPAIIAAIESGACNCQGVDPAKLQEILEAIKNHECNCNCGNGGNNEGIGDALNGMFGTN